MFGMIGYLLPPVGKRVKLLTTSTNRESNIQCLFPAAGQCTTLLSVSPFIVRGGFLAGFRLLCHSFLAVLIRPT